MSARKDYLLLLLGGLVILGQDEGDEEEEEDGETHGHCPSSSPSGLFYADSGPVNEEGREEEEQPARGASPASAMHRLHPTQHP